MNKPAPELIALADERAVLMAKNAAATSWGAAVGARSERIKEIDGLLAAIRPGSERAGVESHAAWQQSRGVAWDIIDQAISEYDEWMLDDDYDAVWKLHIIMGQMRARKALYRDEPDAALTTPPAQPAPAGGESCANSILRAIWDDIETAAVETPVDNYECADIRPETLARLADHLAARNWKDKADVDLPPDDCRAAILPISVRGSESVDLLQPVAPGPSEAPSTPGKPDGAVREAYSALCEPRESDAYDNLDGALIDIKRLSESGKPTDQVCIRTIERVLRQLLKAQQALHSPKIAAVATSPGDVLDACPLCFGSGRHEGRFGHNDPDCTNCNGTGIDRLDVKAEAKPKDEAAVAYMVERKSDRTFPRFYSSRADADALVERVNVSPAATIQPLYIHPTTKPEAPAVSVEWHPQETAPQDGSHILVCSGPYNKSWGFNQSPPSVVHFFNDMEEPGFYLSSGIVQDSYNDKPVSFTHWRSLGKPPAAIAGGR